MTETALAHLADRRESRNTVMVNDETHGRRHLKLYKDADGYYVRTNKRGQTKRYLTTALLIAGIVWQFGYREVI